MSDINITYKNSSIATMDASGTKTIETAGKYCEDDITIEYVRPSGGDDAPDDGKTRVYIHLEEGRTNPMLGCCPNGTVDVDWGDGTVHDTLTGTNASTVKWTPTHHYAAPGDYVIKLTVTGSMGFYGNSSTNQYSALLRNSNSGDPINYYYNSAIKKVVVGSGVTVFGTYSFYNCYCLSEITIPDDVTVIGDYGFAFCVSLTNINIPDSIVRIGSYAFQMCRGLAGIHLASTTPPTLGSSAFSNIPADCVFYVPYSADHSILEAYKTAAGWSTYADRMREESE